MKSVTLSEEPVILERPVVWSRVLVWLIVGIAGSALFWAAVAKIEQAVLATGKLEPQGSVKQVKAPDGGVVRKIYVEDGQRVQKHQLLVTFDPTAPLADLESLSKLRNTLVRENQFYGAELSGGIPSSNPDLRSLALLRESLSEENQFLKAQIDGLKPLGNASGEFNANQQRLLAASRAEIRSRVTAAQLQIEELEKQLSQTQEQIATNKKVLALNQDILNRLEPLVEEGALSKLQSQRQEQEVLTRQVEVDRLNAEQQRLRVGISRAREELQNTIAASAKDILTKIADNQKRIAEIDTQLSQTKLENQKKLTEIEGQLNKAKQAFQYQELRAPANGVVFDLKAHAPGYVASATEPILTIVPQEKLVASVFIENKDIGFVKEGMEVDVKFESFPQTEFGSITGKLLSLGSDVLPPTETRPFYAFPAKIQLERNSFLVNGREIPLQSGMAVNCSIRVRSRTVLSLFGDLFVDKIESLETVR